MAKWLSFVALIFALAAPALAGAPMVITIAWIVTGAPLGPRHGTET